MNGFILQKKVYNQRYEGPILIAPGIAGHQKQQKNHHQIFHIKILGEKSLQKASHAGCGVFALVVEMGGWWIPLRRGVVWPLRRIIVLLWGTAALLLERRLPLRRFPHSRRKGGPIRLTGHGFLDSASAKGAVRLGDISIIHGITFLRTGSLPFPMRFLPFLPHAWPAPAFPASACSGKAGAP